MSNIEKYPKCRMRTSFGNCDPIGGYCTSVNEFICVALHKVAEPKTDEENELKFYYVESLDDYWVGRRIDNFYYANWHDRLGFVWSHSKYLPWGEHIVDENTLWKEHTYPSEPIEIPFTEWIVGFAKKYFAQAKTGRWVGADSQCGIGCPFCGTPVDDFCHSTDYIDLDYEPNFCHHCGVRMKGADDE